MATPMMQQYEEAKRACPDALLLFRMGDFYELFHDDARTAARVLNLALTSREKGDNAVPMAGFPHHQLESYLARLIAVGMRVAICDQVEDARHAQGLVKRALTRVVTPGTLTDDALLDPRENNYLAAVAIDPPPANTSKSATPLAGLAWVELSTGRFFAARLPLSKLADELARIAPAELLLGDDEQSVAAFRAATRASWSRYPDAILPPSEEHNGQLPQAPGAGIPGVSAAGSAASADWPITRRPPWAFSSAAARDKLNAQFGTATLEGFGFDEAADAAPLRAAGAILDYLIETQRTGLAHLDRLVPYRHGSTVEIDPATRRSLEITRTLREGRREHSLLGVLDRTVTAMGSRLLAEWIANPLCDQPALVARHDAVEELVAQPGLAAELSDALKRIHDIERLVARVITGRTSPRDLSFLGRTLGQFPQFKAKLTARRSALLNGLESRIDLCPEIRAELDAALASDCPLSARDGGFIRAGYRPQLDALRELATGGKQWIANYQAAEQQRSGIPSLKVGFNKVFGYYLEITNVHRQRIPADYIRKQTVKNAERYITPELKEYEEKVLTADEKSKELEYELFLALRDTVVQGARRLQAAAAALAELDVLVTFAETARQRGYCRPRLDQRPVLSIRDGRHPVLDALDPAGTFVPNDVTCDPDGAMLLLITGPNMAGKSTYIRQAALIVLMAQIGSFVPAREATIGLADQIFARVGASDELSRGQSTFMVEMTETARILNTATPRSLVILDEIGRGTSTYDGVSLAWAVVEHLHERVGCRTLFATHYHELADLERSAAGVKNLTVSVREWNDEVIFLHKIVDGAADKSYGIQVARLAGVPREVIERAKEILGELEEQHLDAGGGSKLAHRRGARRAGGLQLTLFGPAEHPVVDKIRQLDLEGVSPREALKLLEDWQTELGESERTKPR